MINISTNKFLIKSIHSGLLNNDLFSIESKKIVFTSSNFIINDWKSKDNS